MQLGGNGRAEDGKAHFPFHKLSDIVTFGSVSEASNSLLTVEGIRESLRKSWKNTSKSSFREEGGGGRAVFHVSRVGRTRFPNACVNNVNARRSARTD